MFHFKLSIIGVLDRRPGYLAVGGIFMSQDYCSPRPRTSQKGKNELLRSHMLLDAVLFLSWISEIPTFQIRPAT